MSVKSIVSLIELSENESKDSLYCLEYGVSDI